MFSRVKVFSALGAIALLVIVLMARKNGGSVGPAREFVTGQETAVTPSKNLRPTSPKPTLPEETPALDASPEEQARMQRMADNLLKPQLQLDATAAAKVRSDWVDRFHREQDPLLREEIVTEMVQLDDPLTLKAMMGLLPGEAHPGVREQLLLMLGYLRSAVPEIATLSPMMASAYRESVDPAERARILDVMSNLPTSESMQLLHTAFSDASASFEDRFHAAEGFFKLASGYQVDQELMRQITARLKEDARSAPKPKERLLAAKALAAPGQNNKAFFGELLRTEKDVEVQKFLTLAADEFPTQ
jgi:hypothetical protein